MNCEGSSTASHSTPRMPDTSPSVCRVSMCCSALDQTHPKGQGLVTQPSKQGCGESEAQALAAIRYDLTRQHFNIPPITSMLMPATNELKMNCRCETQDLLLRLRTNSRSTAIEYTNLLAELVEKCLHLPEGHEAGLRADRRRLIANHVSYWKPNCIARSCKQPRLADNLIEPAFTHNQH